MCYLLVLCLVFDCGLHLGVVLWLFKFVVCCVSVWMLLDLIVGVT